LSGRYAPPRCEGRYEKAHQLKKAMAVKEENLLQQIKIETGTRSSDMGSRSIAKAFDKLNLPYEELKNKNTFIY